VAVTANGPSTNDCNLGEKNAKFGEVAGPSDHFDFPSSGRSHSRGAAQKMESSTLAPQIQETVLK
jgi:hypothetical protein